MIRSHIRVLGRVTSVIKSGVTVILLLFSVHLDLGVALDLKKNHYILIKTAGVIGIYFRVNTAVPLT